MLNSNESSLTAQEFEAMVVENFLKNRKVALDQDSLLCENKENCYWQPVSMINFWTGDLSKKKPKNKNLKSFK